MFFGCIGSLFCISEKKKVDETIKHFTENWGAVSLACLVSGEETPKTKVLATELAGMAAIGVTRSQLQQSRTAPLLEAANHFYRIALRGLDHTIVHEPLRAMKLCMLIAFYHVFLHDTVALAYIGE